MEGEDGDQVADVGADKTPLIRRRVKANQVVYYKDCQNHLVGADLPAL